MVQDAGTYGVVLRADSVTSMMEEEEEVVLQRKRNRRKGDKRRWELTGAQEGRWRYRIEAVNWGGRKEGVVA